MKIKAIKAGMISDATIHELSLVMDDPATGKNYTPAVPGANVLLRKALEIPEDRQARIAETLGIDVSRLKNVTPIDPKEKKTDESALASAYEKAVDLVLDTYYAMSTAYYADMFTPDERKKALQRIVDELLGNLSEGDLFKTIVANLVIEKDDPVPAPAVEDHPEIPEWKTYVEIAEKSGRTVTVNTAGNVEFSAKVTPAVAPAVKPAEPPASEPPIVKTEPAVAPTGFLTAEAVGKMISDAVTASETTQKAAFDNRVATLQTLHDGEVATLKTSLDAANELVAEKVQEAQNPTPGAGAANVATPTKTGTDSTVIRLSKANSGLSQSTRALLATRGKATVVLED